MQAIRVLLVDDDAMNAVALRRILELEGIEVVAVSTAEAALCHLGQRAFHVVLTDLRLPGASGQELARRMRQTRLIALSGDTLGLERATWFDVALRKPCDPDVLIRVLRAGPGPGEMGAGETGPRSGR